MEPWWKPQGILYGYTVEKLRNETLSKTGALRTSPNPLLKHHPVRPKLGDSVPLGEEKEEVEYSIANGLVALMNHCFPN